jgi:hypothetical protein
MNISKILDGYARNVAFGMERVNIALGYSQTIGL